jgi:hypothetical protein
MNFGSTSSSTNVVGAGTFIIKLFFFTWRHKQTGPLYLGTWWAGWSSGRTAASRKASASNRRGLQSALAWRGLRENAAEFGLSAKYSKPLRDSLRVAIALASDSRLASRLTKSNA